MTDLKKFTKKNIENCLVFFIDDGRNLYYSIDNYKWIIRDRNSDYYYISENNAVNLLLKNGIGLDFFAEKFLRKLKDKYNYTFKK
jgi:hypothetical protein